MARYPVTQAVSLTGRVNNLFDQRYYTSPWYAYYGTPRQFKLDLSVKF